MESLLSTEEAPKNISIFFTWSNLKLGKSLFSGVAQGTHVNTASQLFSFLQPILRNLVQLLGLYHNYQSIVELILEVFVESAKRILCYLGQADSRALYQVSGGGGGPDPTRK